MQITTATGRTVEIYMNNEAGITYRNVKDGKATGAVRSADRATAKKGSVGREIMDAIDAQAAPTRAQRARAAFEAERAQRAKTREILTGGNAKAARRIRAAINLTW